VSDIVIVTSDSTGAGASKSATANCSDAGEDHHAISGGVEVVGSATGVSITESRPTGIAGEVPGGWQVAADGPAGSGWSVRAYAVCALVS
jgi:hypothetical protein